MIVVADAGPLHYLILIEAAGVLAPLYTRVLVPQAVAGELLQTNTPATVQAWITQPPAWCKSRPNPPSDPTLKRLDPGENAAIMLALSFKADLLLIDEHSGRAAAERRHLQVTGTLGVLAEAHRAGLVDFESALTALGKTNFYLSADLVDRIRRRLSAGEEL